MFNKIPGTAGTAFGRTGTGTEDISLNIGAGSGEGAGGAGAGGEGAGIGEGIGTGVAFLGEEAEMVNGAEILLGKDGNGLAAADLTSTTWATLFSLMMGLGKSMSTLNWGDGICSGFWLGWMNCWMGCWMDCWMGSGSVITGSGEEINLWACCW